jgi:hypothetical protein
MKWIGPFTIDELLNNCFNDSYPRPPELDSIYVISRNMWTNNPTKDCIPLYIGSNTGKSKRFRTRIGDLIADMFGFFGEETGHHSGGQTLYKYCKESSLNPKNLFIGWLTNCKCQRCEENAIYNQLQPSLNKSRPPKCNRH